MHCRFMLCLQVLHTFHNACIPLSVQWVVKGHFTFIMAILCWNTSNFLCLTATGMGPFISATGISHFQIYLEPSNWGLNKAFFVLPYLCTALSLTSGFCVSKGAAKSLKYPLKIFTSHRENAVQLVVQPAYSTYLIDKIHHTHRTVV